jgi:predicted metalloprotease with PDZ domain
MKKLATMFFGALVMLALVTAVPLAGECSHETQVCLDYLANNLKYKGYAGVELDEHDGTMTVRSVFPDTPAERAGVKAGDQLLAINGIRINEENHEKLQALWGEMKPGNTFDYTIARRGKEREIRLTLVEMPEDEVLRIVGKHMMEHATVEVASND